MNPHPPLPADPVVSLAPTHGDQGNPFPIPDDAVDVDFLETAPSGDEGRAVVRRHCELLFVRAHGQWREIFQRCADAHRNTSERLRKEYSRALAKLWKTAPTVRSAKPALSLPQGRKRWLTFWWGFLLIAMAMLTWVNIARFAADETQSWFRAFLYAAPVLFIPLALKWGDEQREADQWTWFRCVLAGIFVVTVIAFDLSFTWRFSYAPTAEEIAQGTTGAGAWDARLQLLSQLVMDPLLALVGFFRLRESLTLGTCEVRNRDYELRSQEAASLEGQLREAVLPVAQYEGLLREFESAKEIFADRGEAHWRQLQSVRQEAERDRQEEERDFQERRVARRSREENRRQRFAAWQAPRGRNGKFSQSTNTNPRP